MRTAVFLNTNTPTTTTSASTMNYSLSSPAHAANMQRSPWHSPMPYLFGGLAAMLGLIAFALMILACSYSRLSRGHLEGSTGGGGERDVERGQENAGDAGKVRPVYEEKIVVIMAGDERPTFLATPVCSRTSLFGDGDGKSEKKEGEREEKGEKQKEDMGNHGQTTTTTTMMITAREENPEHA